MKDVSEEHFQEVNRLYTTSVFCWTVGLGLVHSPASEPGEAQRQEDAVF